MRLFSTVFQHLRLQWGGLQWHNNQPIMITKNHFSLSLVYLALAVSFTTSKGCAQPKDIENREREIVEKLKNGKGKLRTLKKNIEVLDSIDDLKEKDEKIKELFEQYREYILTEAEVILEIIKSNANSTIGHKSAAHYKKRCADSRNELKKLHQYWNEYQAKGKHFYKRHILEEISELITLSGDLSLYFRSKILRACLESSQ